MTDTKTAGTPDPVDWDKIVKVKQPTSISVDLLQFDVTNPRFTPDKRPDENTDAAIVSKLASTADLSELTRSIATSGYINIEPLIVVVRDGCLVVLEGNRRLAAIKALRNNELASGAKLAIPQLSEKNKSTLEEVLVYRVEREEDARELIGFKHINGPQAWDAYAKAVFAAKWLTSQQNSDEKLTLQDIADRMGDNHATIHRMVTAYFALAQAEREDLYSVDDRVKKAFSFSHLYTGLSYIEFLNYLGMKRIARGEDPEKDPVPKDKFPQLKQLLLWLYGSKSQSKAPVVQSQNPDLNTLREVLGSKAAIVELEARSDLSAAVVTATPKHVRFSTHLVNANAELHKAQETLDGFDPLTQPELLEIATSLLRRAAVVRGGISIAIETAEHVEYAGTDDEIPAAEDLANPSQVPSDKSGSEKQ